MSAAGVVVSGEALPEALAVRRPGRHVADRPMWVIRKCPHCGRGHGHIADLTMNEVVLPAKCGEGRFYRVREVAVGGRKGA